MLTHSKVQDIETIVFLYVQWRTFEGTHICLRKQLMEITSKACASPSRNTDKKEKEKKNEQANMVVAKLFALHANGVKLTTFIVPKLIYL